MNYRANNWWNIEAFLHGLKFQNVDIKFNKSTESEYHKYMFKITT